MNAPTPSRWIRPNAAKAKLSLSPLPRWGIEVTDLQLTGPAIQEGTPNEHRLCLVVQGTVTLKISGRSIAATPGSIIHFVDSTPCRLEPGADNRFVCLMIRYRPTCISHDIRRLLQSVGTLCTDLGPPKSHKAQSFRSEFQEMLYEQTRRLDGWRLALTSGLGRILVRLVRLPTPLAPPHSDPFDPMPEAAGRVARHLHLLETTFHRRQRLDDAAASAQLSRRRFTQLFRQLTGTSWRHHLEELRLRNAEQLLLQTKKSVLEIAMEVGFEDVASFNRTFKQHHGMPPSRFRTHYATEA